jgi:hypothetical protein
VVKNRQTPKTASSVRRRGPATSTLITDPLTRTPLSALMGGTPGAAGEAPDVEHSSATAYEQLSLMTITCKGGQRSPSISSILTPCQCAVPSGKSPAGLSSRDTRPMVVGSSKPRTVVNLPKPGADSSSRVYVVSWTRRDQEPGSRRALLVRSRRLSSRRRQSAGLPLEAFAVART